MGDVFDSCWCEKSHIGVCLPERKPKVADYRDHYPDDPQKPTPEEIRLKKENRILVAKLRIIELEKELQDLKKVIQDG